MTKLTEELARKLPVMFRSMARLLGVELDKHELGIRITEFGVLDFLLTNSQAVQTDLANHFAKSAILRQLDGMEQAGWVERQQDPNDRRRKNLVVTKKGMEVYRKADKLRNAVFAKLLEGVAVKDLTTALAVLNTMNDNANSGDL